MRPIDPKSTTRRQVFASAGAFALAWASDDSAQAARAAVPRFPPRLPGQRRIETAIATICCDGFGDENFEPSFAAVPKLGIKNVEFNVWYPRNLTPAGLDGIASRCRARKLRPISLQATGFSPGETNDDLSREVGRLLWLIESCRKLGCRILKCTGSKRGTRGGLPALVTVLREILPAAEAAGIAITLENHYDNTLELPEDYDTIFAQIDSPALGICMDMGHFFASGVDLDAFIARFSKRIYHLDVKDCAAVGPPKFVRYGTGGVPIERTIETALGHGYTGYLVIELSLLDRATMLDDLRAGLAITKKFER